MALKVGIVRESFPGERRVALTPVTVKPLVKGGIEVLVEAGAGVPAGFPDAEYQKAGATIVAGRADVFAGADVVAQVRTLGSNPVAGRSDLALMHADQVLIGFSEPLSASAETMAELAKTGVSTFAMELMPRITRAQTMDALSSQATIAGYAAVLLAGRELPKMFPLLMTAAGTVPAAKVFVIGAGVAGLQAIATAKRLGAVVSAYDVRAAVKDQVISVGGRFVEMAIDASKAEGKGGYAAAMDADFYRRQRELLTEYVATHDVVITTAAVPGAKSPLLVTEDMVKKMQLCSVIVDLAAERGGNCELTKADTKVEAHGVTILGPTNLAATLPHDASLMYSRNVLAFLQHLVQDGRIDVDRKDEIVEATLLTRSGEVAAAPVRKRLGLPEAVAA
ncbi:MAG: NAD(P) transhydrogenase subunit alpha [Phycisphaerales bacterium]